MAKLGDYLPEVPQLVNQMTEFNENLNLLQLMKASSETSTGPTLGLDHVVNTWVRHQMAYRQQLVMDLQTITYSVAEIRSPLGHITSEVFRRGVKILPKVENPSMEEKERLEKQRQGKFDYLSDEEVALKEKKYELTQLNKTDQVNMLMELGLSAKEIKALKYEADRVNKIIELTKNE